jgi:hypothetical protein
VTITNSAITEQDTSARVATLRQLAETDPGGAQEAAWTWFKQLGEKTATDREAGAAALAELFATGSPSQGLDGPTDGILVAPLIQPRVDAAARLLTKFWMPWKGKRFHAADQTGDNRMTVSSSIVGRLLWPLYGFRADAGDQIAFDFQTRVETGGIDPKVDVFVIDYAPVESNPRLIIKSIRDELVEIVPGAHLGRILFRKGEGDYDNWGYLALRTAVS